MIFCLDKSFCEPRPKSFEHSYQCCNSCDNSKCPNRCKDDCKVCGRVADKEWIKQQEKRYSIDNIFSRFNHNSKPDKKLNKTKDGKNKKPTLTQEEIKARKREARRRRRLARKSKEAIKK